MQITHPTCVFSCRGAPHNEDLRYRRNDGQTHMAFIVTN
jgi:hypothetical protein